MLYAKNPCIITFKSHWPILGCFCLCTSASCFRLSGPSISRVFVHVSEFWGRKGAPFKSLFCLGYKVFVVFRSHWNSAFCEMRFPSCILILEGKAGFWDPCMCEYESGWWNSIPDCSLSKHRGKLWADPSCAMPSEQQLQKHLARLRSAALTLQLLSAGVLAFLSSRQHQTSCICKGNKNQMMEKQTELSFWHI